MRNHFQNQLAELENTLVSMGAMCENSISSAMTALSECDKKAAARAISLERELDCKEHQVELFCLRLLMQQQPVARDLRQISAALKMITDMERIGDQAADIADMIKSADLSRDLGRVHLEEMAAASIRMVTQSIDAFVRHDLELAQKVCAEDDIVDELFNTVKRELVSFIAAEPDRGEEAIDLLMVAKYLERIGDHASNIAEWVIFSITGKHEGQEHDHLH